MRRLLCAVLCGLALAAPASAQGPTLTLTNPPEGSYAECGVLPTGTVWPSFAFVTATLQRDGREFLVIPVTVHEPAGEGAATWRFTTPLRQQGHYTLVLTAVAGPSFALHAVFHVKASC